MAIEKFKALVHLIVASCDDPHRLGATRLNKICWFADTAAYRAFGTSISGESYLKRANGPVPKYILKAIRELQAEGKILVKQQDHPIYKTRLFYSLETPGESLFSKHELEIIEGISASICRDFTATSISEVSHDQIWKAAEEGEEIPLYATLVSDRGELTEDISAWADSVVNNLIQTNRTDQAQSVATR